MEEEKRDRKKETDEGKFMRAGRRIATTSSGNRGLSIRAPELDCPIVNKGKRRVDGQTDRYFLRKGNPQLPLREMVGKKPYKES